MVLESIAICIDNSEYMRNEDYQPNRMKAQIDAVQVLIYTKLRASAENCLGIVTMANNRVLTHLTNQESKLLANLSQVEVEGSIRLLQSLSVAQLVLKHRPIKHAKCRIIAFVGSPVLANESDMSNLGKRFKKENVNVDIITFGCEPGVVVLRTLVDTLNGPSGTQNSFHSVPPYMVISDYLVSSGLAAAHREYGMPDNDVDEDEELRRAIEWSMQETGGSSVPQPTAQPTGIQDGNDLSEDEQLRIALQLSLQEAERLEAIREGPTQPSNARTFTLQHPQQDGPNDPEKPDSTSPTNIADSAGQDTSTTNTDLTNNPSSDKEKNSPNSKSNNTNPNPNNNNHNAANTPNGSESGKNTAESKEIKKTILTKKR